jgi:hypothetical protein
MNRFSVRRWLGVMAVCAPAFWIGAACGVVPAAQDRGGTVAEAKADPRMNPELAARVPVVLRVKYVKLIGGQKYSWDEVSVQSTLKNQSSRSFTGAMEIGHYDWEAGVPNGESTVYLEPYAEGDESRWKLLGGSAKEGVSHAEAAK